MKKVMIMKQKSRIAVTIRDKYNLFERKDTIERTICGFVRSSSSKYYIHALVYCA